MSAAQPFFTVIIPVYNAELFIKETLESLFAQNFCDFEVVLVDDGSLDGTYDVIVELINADDRFLVLKQENSGPNIARNNAINLAKGKYLLFLDSDDVFSTDALESVYYFAKSGKFDMIEFGFDFSDFVSGKVFKKSSGRTGYFEDDRILLEAFSNKLISSVCWNKCIRRRLILEHDIRFTPDRHHGRDIHFVRQVCFYANSLQVMSDILVHSRIRHGSFSRTFSVKNVSSAVALVYEHRKFFHGRLSGSLLQAFERACDRHLRYIFVLCVFRSKDYSQFRLYYELLVKEGLLNGWTPQPNDPKNFGIHLLRFFPRVAWFLRCLGNLFNYHPY